MCKYVLTSGPNKGKICSRSQDLDWCWQHDGSKTSLKTKRSSPKRSSSGYSTPKASPKPSPRRLSPKKSPPKRPPAVQQKKPPTGFFIKVKQNDLEYLQKFFYDEIVDARNSTDATLLMVAAMNGNLDICLFLLKHRANITLKDKWGNTALHYAAMKGHYDISKLLIQKGANVNAKTKYNTNVLYAALMNKHKAVCGLLIANGAIVPDNVAQYMIHEGPWEQAYLTEEATKLFNTLKEIPLYKNMADNRTQLYNILLASFPRLEKTKLYDITGRLIKVHF